MNVDIKSVCKCKCKFHHVSRGQQFNTDEDRLASRRKGLVDRTIK